MRIPLELEHLIKSTDLKSTDLKSTDLKSADLKSADLKSADLKAPETTTPTGEPKDKTLAGRLEAIEARKALEVEHYLRACALRLDLQ
jgi:hypothetical protein